MNREIELQSKLQKVESLYYGAKTSGEKRSAIKAKKRILDKLNNTQDSKEYKFTLDNELNVSIFLNLLRRYEIQGYRKDYQESTVVMAKVCGGFVDKVLWPEYQSIPKRKCC